jgi:hypothetical protein
MLDEMGLLFVWVEGGIVLFDVVVWRIGGVVVVVEVVEVAVGNALPRIDLIVEIFPWVHSRTSQ